LSRHSESQTLPVGHQSPLTVVELASTAGVSDHSGILANSTNQNWNDRARQLRCRFALCLRGRLKKHIRRPVTQEGNDLRAPRIPDFRLLHFFSPDGKRLPDDPPLAGISQSQLQQYGFNRNIGGNLLLAKYPEH